MKREARLLLCVNPLADGYICTHFNQCYVNFCTSDGFDAEIAWPYVLIYSLTPQVNVVVHNHARAGRVNE